ncbi:TonB-dependent receptor [Alteromonas sp. NFXS44]|uniref:TonB-dependent receptor n=1 Tax=Alteromonas sp. NFXS44 TaxID=2818435 RepID=UPI0032DFC6ED
MSEDNDGPAASAFISAYDINDFAGNVVVQGQSNCLINGNPYFCSVPDKADPISYNTSASEAMKTLLSSTENRLTSSDMLDDYGMAREFSHGHIVADWELGDYTLSSLTGVNKEEWVLLNDIDHYGADFFNYPYLVERREEDFSQEFRLSYDAGGAFSGTAGLSYLDASKFNTLTTLLYVVPDSVTPGGESNAETTGGFFGLNYAFNDQLSTSLEGRYQRDTITSFDSTGNELASESFNNFLPRFIVDYKFDKDTMAYVSFSKGVNPSAFNTGLLTLTDYGREQAEAAGITLAVKPEKVNNYEPGLKGTTMDGSMTYALAAYYAEWTDQINRNNLVYTEPGGETAISFSGVSNTGNVDLYGLELESNWAVTSNIRVNLAGAYTGSEINSFTNTALTALTGISDFSGKEQPNVSEYSGNIGVQYDGEFSDALYYFMRADYVFKSGQWVNQANFLKTGAIQKVNLRAGFTVDNIHIQVFVNKAFEDTDYTTGYDYFAFQYDFAYFGNNSGLVMGLPEPRTFGLQAKWSFY